MGWAGKLAAAGLASLVTHGTYRQLTAPGSLARERFERVNHRGGPVTLAQGPATVAGSVAGILLTPGLPGRLRGAASLAVGAAGALGAYDDLFGNTATKGFRGHLVALSQGELTSGSVKLAGIGTTGLVAGAWSRGGRGGFVDAALAGVVVAGAANLLNLFDLRPGRAAKVYFAVAAPALLVGGEGCDLLAGPTGAVAALFPEDLAERSMMGDAGANAAGAVLGVAAAATLSRRNLAAVAAGLIGLTLMSERVSFSTLIDEHRALRVLDSLGRHRTS